MTGATAPPTFATAQTGFMGPRTQGSIGMSAARRVGGADALDILQAPLRGDVTQVPGAVLSLQRGSTGHVGRADGGAVLRAGQGGDVGDDGAGAVEDLDVVPAVGEVDAGRRLLGILMGAGPE